MLFRSFAGYIKVRPDGMRAVLMVLVALVLGPVVGWLVLAFLCNMTGTRYSATCQNHAYAWLPLFAVAGIVASWYFFARSKLFKHQSKNETSDQRSRDA